MKRKTHRSKVTDKRYSLPAFPRVSRQEADEHSVRRKKTGGSFELDRAPVVHSGEAAVCYFCIKNFQDIVVRMRDDPEKFGTCLNRLIEVYADIVLSDGGVMGKFSETGARFAFLMKNSPVNVIRKSLVACLRMRYVINKLNRQWELFRDPWQVCFGVDYGGVTVERFTGGETPGYYALTGGAADNAEGIGRSAGSTQIYITDPAVLRFPSLETAFDINVAKHVPVRGTDHLGKIREVTGMAGPQAKKIFEVFV